MGFYNVGYILLIILGVFGSIVVFFASDRRFVQYSKCVPIFFASTVISFVLASLFMKLLNYVINITRTDIAFYQSSFSFFYTATLILCISAVLLRLFRLPVAKNLNAYLPCLLICLVFGRLGCMTAGCCNSVETAIGIIPFSTIECIGAGVLFLVMMIFKNSFLLHKIIVGYTLYRFVADFWKETYFFEKLLMIGLTPMQIICIVILVSYSVVFVTKMLKKSNEVFYKYKSQGEIR